MLPTEHKDNQKANSINRGLFIIPSMAFQLSADDDVTLWMGL